MGLFLGSALARLDSQRLEKVAQLTVEPVADLFAEVGFQCPSALKSEAH